jgi:hypothetical protein
MQTERKLASRAGEGDADRLASAAKALSDLDALLRSSLNLISPLRPWQRKLLHDLSEAERHMQILRMTIAMDRPTGEMHDAASRLLVAVRTASAGAECSRGDQATKLLLQTCVALAKRLEGALRAQADDIAAEKL